MSGIKLSQLQELTSIDVTSNDILLLACDETGPYTSSTISLNTLYNSFNIASTTANTGNYSFSSNTISNAAGMLLDTGRGVLALGTDMEAPGVPNHFHIAFQNSNSQIIDKELFLGDDYNYIKVGQYNGVNISSYDRIADLGNQKTWNFGNNGNLTLPGTIVHSTNSIGIGGVSRVAAVTLDVTKSIHKLLSGWYYLPDGVEGQLVYLSLATGSTPLDIKVDFQHARLNESANAPYDNGPIFSNVFGNAYDVSANARPPSLVTVIFIDGAWVCSPDGVWD